MEPGCCIFLQLSVKLRLAIEAFSSLWAGSGRQLLGTKRVMLVPTHVCPCWPWGRVAGQKCMPLVLDKQARWAGWSLFPSPSCLSMASELRGKEGAAPPLSPFATCCRKVRPWQCPQHPHPHQVICCLC